jgi:hypothetical protein
VLVGETVEVFALAIKWAEGRAAVFVYQGEVVSDTYLLILQPLLFLAFPTACHFLSLLETLCLSEDRLGLVETIWTKENRRRPKWAINKERQKES